MALQARKIGIPMVFLPISEPYKLSYRQQIEAIRDSGIEVLITGDISTVGGMPNWIDDVAAGLVGVHKPLWELDRYAILDALISNSFEVICSLSYKKYFQSTITGWNDPMSLSARQHQRCRPAVLLSWSPSTSRSPGLCSRSLESPAPRAPQLQTGIAQTEGRLYIAYITPSSDEIALQGTF